MSGEQLPTIEGWLDKQGGVRKSWKRRYFVLDGKKLKYFKQHKDVPHKPIDAINLERTTKVIYVRDKVRPTDLVPGCGFAIETTSRTYILAAGSVSERDKWATDIQLALSVLYGLPKPVVLPKDRSPSPPPRATAERSQRSQTLNLDATGGIVPSRDVSPRYSMAFSEVPVHQPPVTDNTQHTRGGTVMEAAPVIDDYSTASGANGSGAEAERRMSSRHDLLHLAKNGLSALNPITAAGFGTSTPLGRKDEVEMLKEELMRKDRQLEMTERKLKILDSAYADLAEKYFVSVAIFAKMNAATEGYYCNIDVYQLYAEAQRLKVESHDWPHWITAEIQKNASRMRS